MIGDEETSGMMQSARAAGGLQVEAPAGEEIRKQRKGPEKNKKGEYRHVIGPLVLSEELEERTARQEVHAEEPSSRTGRSERG